MTKIKLNISGMHCGACKTLIETELKEIKGVEKINVVFKKGIAFLEFDEKQTSLEDISQVIVGLNYQASSCDVGENNEKKQVNFGKIFIKFLIGVIFFAIAYFLLDYFNVWQLTSALNEPEISLFLMFAIGVISSFHCVGMCGGIIVSFNQGKKISQRPLQANLSYNSGRIISYSVLGFLLGSFGSLFKINPDVSGVMVFLTAVFMFLFGISMFFGHSWTSKIMPRIPSGVAKFIFKNKKKKSKGPFFIGLATALMPCGPLQAVQIFALSTGSGWDGALAMFVYSLGTTPLLLGFGQVISWFSRERVKVIMRFSGVLVIGLAIVMFNRSLSFFGHAEPDENTNNIETNQEYQEVNMKIGFGGYQPNVLYVEKGKPVRWIIDGSGITGCTNEILMPDYGIKKKLNKGINIIEFTPKKEGEIKFSCWMRMVWGKFIVK